MSVDGADHTQQEKPLSYLKELFHDQEVSLGFLACSLILWLAQFGPSLCFLIVNCAGPAGGDARSSGRARAIH